MKSVERIIKIGTRTSELAMIQTQLVMAKIKEKVKNAAFEIISLQTLGDRLQDRPLLSFGGKGAFVSEFETALLSGQIDLAVHSAKDMPIELPEGLEIVGIPEREDPRDVLVTMRGKELQEGAIIGTSSLRRQLQISSLRKVTCKDLRGNVNTRLKKLEEGQYEGIIVAAAGLKRLGLHQEEKYDYHYFSCEEFVPAGGQGIMAVEGRRDDEVSKLVTAINDEEAALSLKVERQVLKLLNAGCHEPIGVYSFIRSGRLYLTILNARNGSIQRIAGSSEKEKSGQLAVELIEQLKK